MEVKKHSRLSLKERVIIKTLLEENKTKAHIAKTLNSARSTISREVNKLVTNLGGKYNVDLAYWCAKDDYLNKINLDKRHSFSTKVFAYKGLLSDWTSEQISGRIKFKSIILPCIFQIN